MKIGMWGAITPAYIRMHASSSLYYKVVVFIKADKKRPSCEESTLNHISEMRIRADVLFPTVLFKGYSPKILGPMYLQAKFSTFALAVVSCQLFVSAKYFCLNWRVRIGTRTVEFYWRKCSSVLHSYQSGIARKFLKQRGLYPCKTVHFILCAWRGRGGTYSTRGAKGGFDDRMQKKCGVGTNNIKSVRLSHDPILEPNHHNWKSSPGITQRPPAMERGRPT